MKENYLFNVIYNHGEEYKSKLEELAYGMRGHGMPALLGLICKTIGEGFGDNSEIIAVCGMLYDPFDKGDMNFSAEFIQHLIMTYEGSDPEVHLWQRDENHRLYITQPTICELSLAA